MGGLIAGSISHVYLSTWPEVQMIVPLLLSAAVPGFAKTPLYALADLQHPGPAVWVEMAMDICSLIFMLYTRFYIFVPLSIGLCKRVIAEVSPGIGYTLIVPLSLFGLFNLMGVLMGIYATTQDWKHATHEEKQSTKKLLRRHTSLLSGGLNMHQSSSHLEVHGSVRKSNLKRLASQRSSKLD